MSTFSLVLHSDVAMSLLRSQTGLSIHHCSADPTLSSVDTMMVGCRRTTAPVSREGNLTPSLSPLDRSLPTLRREPARQSKTLGHWSLGSTLRRSATPRLHWSRHGYRQHSERSLSQSSR